MKTRQRVGLAIALVVIYELQLLSMPSETLEGAAGAFITIVALLCLGIGVVMLVVGEEA